MYVRYLAKLNMVIFNLILYQSNDGHFTFFKYFLTSFVFYGFAIAVPSRRYGSVDEELNPLILTKYGLKRPMTKLQIQEIYGTEKSNKHYITEDHMHGNDNGKRENSKYSGEQENTALHKANGIDVVKPVKIKYKGYSLFISTRDYVTNLISKIKRIMENYKENSKEGSNNTDELGHGNWTYIPYCQYGNLNTKFECLKKKLLEIVQELTLRQSLQLAEGISLDREPRTILRYVYLKHCFKSGGTTLVGAEAF